MAVFFNFLACGFGYFCDNQPDFYTFQNYFLSSFSYTFRCPVYAYVHISYTAGKLKRFLAALLVVSSESLCG